MKVLSLMQPWASLVVMGVKKIETRNWTTAYRGPLLIHASQSKAGAELAAAGLFKKYISSFKDLPFGALIGQAILTDIVRTEALDLPDHLLNQLTLEEKAFGDYGFGRYGWLLEEAETFEAPIPAKGQLGIWEFEEEALRALLQDASLSLRKE